MKRKIYKKIKRLFQFIVKPLRPFMDRVVYTMRSGPARGFKRKGGFMFIPAPEIDTELMLKKLNLNNKIVYDIGANFGLMSLAYSKSSSKVFAFEPNPVTFPLLKEIIQLNKITNIDAFNIAVGSKREKSKLVVHKGRRGSGSLNNSIIEKFEKEGHNKYYNVDIYPLDEFVKENNLPLPNFIKIDTEGFEYDCLLGMKNIIKHVHPDFDIEIHQVYILDGRSYTENIVRFLVDMGYNIYSTSFNKLITLEDYSTIKTGHLFCSVSDINLFISNTR
jgi:FkbM family methyltransferase